jgi:hypothetical protein
MIYSIIIIKIESCNNHKICTVGVEVATKVKDTPILKGKDAERFSQKMKEAENNPISKAEYERMLDVFNRVRIA